MVRYSILICLGIGLAPLARARKGSEPVYIDPFDLAAGGAALTRASREGRIYANPALMPYGDKFHRWLGETTTLLSTRETIDTARDFVQSASGQKSSSQNTGSTREFVDKLFETPVRVGWSVAASYVAAQFGLGVFSRFEPDLRAREFGRYGLPEVVFTAESYHGAALAVATQSPWRWLSFGLTGKYIYALEPDIAIDITDDEAIRDLQNQSLTPDLSKHYRGVGVDAGMLLFFQGTHVDWSLASKIDDIGGLAFSEGSRTAPDDYAPRDFRQVVSAGAGMTLHTGADAVHLAIDYRDAFDAYDEEPFKKFYAGTKVLLRTYIGLAAGIYHGYPSFGAELDLLIMRLSCTTYTRELGDRPGVDPRRIVMGSVSTGF